MTSDAQTIDVYNANVEHFDAQFSKRECYPCLEQFIESIPKGTKVLDLGCGPGYASRIMRDAGLHPDPIDASSDMVAYANQHYGINARLGTFDSITGTAIYHGIWANYSLLHAARTDLPRYLGALHTSCVDGGLLHLAMKKGAGERRDAMGRLYTYVSTQELKDMVSKAGFTVRGVEETDIVGLAGNPDISLTLCAHA